MGVTPKTDHTHQMGATLLIATGTDRRQRNVDGETGIQRFGRITGPRTNDAYWAASGVAAPRCVLPSSLKVNFLGSSCLTRMLTELLSTPAEDTGDGVPTTAERIEEHDFPGFGGVDQPGAGGIQFVPVKPKLLRPIVLEAVAANSTAGVGAPHEHVEGGGPGPVEAPAGLNLAALMQESVDSRFDRFIRNWWLANDAKWAVCLRYFARQGFARGANPITSTFLKADFDARMGAETWAWFNVTRSAGPGQHGLAEHALVVVVGVGKGAGGAGGLGPTRFRLSDPLVAAVVRNKLTLAAMRSP